MSGEFRLPDFNSKSLELRYENGIVCIYGTAVGLKYLAELILDLVQHPNRTHVHLDKQVIRILTPESEEGAVAIFEN